MLFWIAEIHFGREKPEHANVPNVYCREIFYNSSMPSIYSLAAKEGNPFLGNPDTDLKMRMLLPYDKLYFGTFTPGNSIQS